MSVPARKNIKKKFRIISCDPEEISMILDEEPSREYKFKIPESLKNRKWNPGYIEMDFSNVISEDHHDG